MWLALEGRPFVPIFWYTFTLSLNSLIVITCEIGSLQFVFAAGTAIGPALGPALFVHVGHKVWWALVPLSAFAASLGMTAVRNPDKKARAAAWAG